MEWTELPSHNFIPECETSCTCRFFLFHISLHRPGYKKLRRGVIVIRGAPDVTSKVHGAPRAHPLMID